MVFVMVTGVLVLRWPAAVNGTGHFTDTKNDLLHLALVHDRNERSQGQGKPSECFPSKSTAWTPLRPIDALR
jgi:hypothetical protein